VKAFVYTSSASVVHDSVSDMTEGDDSLPLLYLPDQTEIYSHSKAVADQLVLDANSTTAGGMRTTCIRPSGIFGEGDAVTKAFAENAAAGKLKWQVGNGKNLFDWTFNENVIHAQFLAAEALLKAHVQTPASDDMRVAGQGFIITNDEHISFWKFARLIGNAAGHPTREEDVRSMPKVIGLTMAAIAEWVTWIISFGRKTSRLNRVGIKFSCMTRTFRIDKAKRALGYKPRVSLVEAIERSGKSCRRQESKKKA
jgi:sterol-4alpha-carboxylate 3-dehydrogenase (decarboxylating)